MANPEMGPCEPEEKIPQELEEITRNADNKSQAEIESQISEFLTEAGAERGLEAQDSILREAEKKESSHVFKTLDGWRKQIGVALLFGASLVSVGCNTERPSVEKPESQKIESTQGGFKDNARENVQQRLRIKKAEIKHMKETKGYQPSKEDRNTAREMNEELIVQPINNGSDSTNRGGDVQHPDKEVKPGPSGGVMNPKDL